MKFNLDFKSINFDLKKTVHAHFGDNLDFKET